MSKSTKIIVLVFCIIKLALHLLADSHSGFQGDELLHIETGKHLAFGYMEFPPIIGFFAYIQNLFNSDSVFIHHIFAHISSIIIIIYLSKIVVELGGKEKAVFFTLLGFLISPGFYRSEQLFQPVVFSQLFWVLSFYYLVKFILKLENKNLWYLTLFCILGFFAKYDAVFFIFGLISLLLFRRTRIALIQQKFWKNAAVFIVCILPNLLWQYQNNFPVLQMFARLNETQLEDLSKLEILKGIFISINPLSSILLVIPAIIYFFKTKNLAIKQIGLSILFSFLFLLFKNGKAYYFFPMILTMLPFGALFWQKYVLTAKKWVFYPISIFLFLGVILIPFGMPVYNFHRYLAKIYPFEKREIEGGKYAVKYDEYYSDEKWKTTMKDLKIVYDSLPKSEKQNCLMWGKHYSQAGAVDLFGKKYNLPKAFSYHGSFYSWAPKNGEMPTTTIALSNRVGNFFKDFFDEVTLVKTIYNPYAENEEELYQRIYICKKPKQNFKELKQKFVNRIFE